MQLTIARTRVLWLLAVSACCLCSFNEASAYFRGRASSAATLSAQTAQADGTDHALLAVSTTAGSGTLYYDISTSCGLTPTAAQVKSGTVTGSVVNGSQAVSGSGAQAANPAGLSAVTTYCAYYTQNTAGGDATVVATSSFKTPGNITFSKIYDSSFTSAQGGALVAAMDAVFAIVADCFHPAVNITVTYEIGVGNLTELGFTGSNAFTVSYSSVLRAQLIALPNKNSVMHALFDNPPASDPLGITDNYRVSCSQAKAFGGACAIQDATTDFSSNFTYDPAVPPANCSTSPCFQKTALHEVTEGIGRQWGQQFGNPGLMEFSAYTATNTRQPNSSTGPLYPSIDNGQTNLIAPFEYSAGCTSSCDVGDFTSAGVDAFTAFTSGALTGQPSAQDIKAMTAIGWSTSHACRITAGL